MTTEFEKALRERGIDHAATMAAKREAVEADPTKRSAKMSMDDWGEGKKDWWATEYVKLGKGEGDLDLVRGFYIETKKVTWEDREGETQEGMRHMILLPKTSMVEPTRVVILKGSAAIDSFMSGKAKGTAVGIKFLEKKVDKGKLRNFYDFQTYPDRTLDKALYPDFAI